MGYFTENRNVTFEDLRQVVDNEGKRTYSEELLQRLEYGDFDYLNNISLLDRNNEYFMEPLLYAVRNSELSTYKVYAYYGEELQKEDLEIAMEVVISEPEIIEGIPISNDRNFIKSMSEVNPEVVIYMSEKLKSDVTFTQELCELNISEVTKYAAQECKMPETIQANPELANNEDFMIGLIQQDANSLEYASDELKNDYEFIKKVCSNEDVINYVTENTDEFGDKGLTAAKDVLVDKSSDEAIAGFKAENDKIKEELESNTAKDENELEALFKRDKQLQRHIRFFERIQNGEIDPVRAAKLIDKICVNLDERYREQIKKVLKLDEAIAEKQKVVEEKAGEQENAVITHESVERKTIPVATITGIQVATEGIREDFKMEEERVSQQANIELGENI